MGKLTSFDPLLTKYGGSEEAVISSVKREIRNILKGTYKVEEVSVGENFGYDLDDKYIEWIIEYTKSKPKFYTGTEIANIKSFCGSGRYRYFCLLCPSPAPNSPPRTYCI